MSMLSLRQASSALLALSFSALVGGVGTGCADPAGDATVESAEAELSMGNKPWDDQAETEWAAWVQKIGEARASGRCRNVNACLNSRDINPLKAAGDADLDVFADCADLPIEMRGYFALKTGRPFEFTSEIASTSGDDPRYARGNHPTSFKDARSYSTMQRMMSAISGAVHSGHYRMAGNVADSDTYPVDVTPATVKPGTIFYDPNGHVLLVYKVDPSGTVHLMDGHPDNSLTFGIFSERFAVGGASQGGGFRRFRPLEFDGQTVRRVANTRLATVSLGLSPSAQYGRGAAYYPWVRERLSDGAPIQPILELGQLVDQLCIDLKERATAVTAAAGVANGPLGPVPANIYGASGEWEALSTPSRDARFKASFRGLRRFIESTGTMVDQRSSRIEWSGSRSELLAAYAAKWLPQRTSCSITYKNSAGRSVSLTLGEVETRLFDLSFDPYHCPELRWGAYPNHPEEAASCRMDAAHERRYADEERQRNAIDREYGSPTPFTFGPEQPENVSLTEILR